jgi:hypothetical protein
VPTVPDHGHTKRGDGGLLSSSIYADRMPLVLNALRSTGLTAAVATASVVTGAAPGLWRLNVYVTLTALTVAGTLTVTLGWTDAGGATTNATITKAVTAAPDRFSGTVLADVASGNLTYAVAVGLFTGTYQIRVVPERLVT